MLCTKAKDATIERIATAGMTSFILYLTDPNPQASFWNYFWQVSKYVIKNDKQTYLTWLKPYVVG